MKVIIAGSRTIGDTDQVIEAVNASGFLVSEVVSGCAPGADAQGEILARHLGLPVRRFPADWDKNGKAAGPIRNRQMAEYADACVVVWDGESRGAQSMIDEARKKGIPLHVHNLGQLSTGELT